MKKLNKIFRIVLVAVLLLTAVSTVRPAEAEAAVKTTTKVDWSLRYTKRLTVTKTSPWYSGAYVKIKNTSGSTLVVSVEGGYAAKDGYYVYIPSGESYKFSFGALSAKNSSFYLYLTSNNYSITSRSNCTVK